MNRIFDYLSNIPFPKHVKKSHKVIVGIILLVIILLYYFFVHPTLNLQSFTGLWFIISLLVLFFLYTLYIRTLANSVIISKIQKVLVSLVFLLIVGGVLGFLFSSKIFHAKLYSKRINVEQVDFSNKTISDVDFTKTPILDRKSTEKLGDKVMGDMPELVSQFEVSDAYTQISYKNSVYRVTPLEYAGFFKYLTNRSEGIPAYIIVNSTNGKTQLVKLKDLGLDGMKYVPSAYFGENLQRRLQLKYPTKIFGTPSFEIDEKGHPYYICTTYGYYGVNSKQYVNGMVLFDPITGDSKKYDVGHFPKWVDRIYPESLIMNEVDDNGSLKNGFLNSIIGQKNVTVTSDGYNYLEKDGDIWIYSGITSANKDTSNLGFVLTNLRTHRTLKFACSGADEKAAMASAEGEVKNYGYDATFPLLVNVAGHPVYLLSLKDSGGLVKMYAMVDAKDYQSVTVVSADSYNNLDLLKKQYIANLAGESSESVKGKLSKATIVVNSVNFMTIDGKTKAYIVDDKGLRYKIEATNTNEDILAFMHTGDKYEIEYLKSDDIQIIKSIKKN